MSAGLFLRGMLLVATLAAVVLCDFPVRAVEYVDDWAYGEGQIPDRSTWAAYYTKNARVRLGREQRLADGTSWRVLVDSGTGIGMPRITWMPDARRLRTANRLLDTVHSGAMLFAEQAERELRQFNETARELGWAKLETDHAIQQTDVGVTCATVNFLSVVDLEYVVSEGTGVTRIIRGLTFDLGRAEMFHIDACPGSDSLYGVKNHLFRFGELLAVCDRDAYVRFVDIVEAKGQLLAKQTAKSRDQRVVQCSEHAGPFIGKDQDIVLYLTVAGLAVHNTSFWPNASQSYCPLKRSPVNPVIIPYRELLPFMKPGPMRDELLK